MDKSPKAFFTYSRSDSEFALKLASDLRKAGVNIWIDQLDIEAGKRWDIQIEDAIEHCDTILVLLSPQSVLSDNVLDEITYAIDARKSVMPIMLVECKVPFRIRRFQHVDFTKTYKEPFARLLKSFSPEEKTQKGKVNIPALNIIKSNYSSELDALEIEKQLADKLREKRERQVEIVEAQKPERLAELEMGKVQKGKKQSQIAQEQKSENERLTQLVGKVEEREKQQEFNRAGASERDDKLVNWILIVFAVGIPLIGTLIYCSYNDLYNDFWSILIASYFIFLLVILVIFGLISQRGPK